MRKPILIAAAAVLAVSGNAAYADEAMNELNMGLDHNNVFNTPTPEAVNYSTVKPGKSDRLAKAYSTAPPQIPHRINEDLPITAEENGCLDCHDRRKLLGKTWRKGKKLPMPDSHYGSFAKAGGTEDVAGARYNCMQCHVPQSDAKLLVENNFK